MKPGVIALWLVGIGIAIGTIPPETLTETLKGGAYILYRTTGTVDSQVDQANEPIRDRDRPWNQKVDANLNN